MAGIPRTCPGPLRDAFVEDSTALNAEATSVIEDNYFRRVGSEELGNASVDGMVRSIRRHFKDRFSHYFSPENLARFNESISGRFSGVGLSVSEVKRGLRVGRVFPNTPASRAGIACRRSDRLRQRAIDRRRGRRHRHREDQGAGGERVTIGVLRPSRGGTRSIRLTREQIALPIATSRIIQSGGQRLGYVALLGFTEGAHRFLRRAVRKVEQQGAEGIVLDLRGNGGGLLKEAVLTSSIFLPKGEVVVSTRSRTQGNTVYKTVGGNLPSRPMVVLINRDTASAAEILASALADDGDATVVGTRSFGKGVFQQVIDLSSGGALDLTIGEFFTADGISLAGKGIKPDVRALDDPRTPADEGLARALDVLGRLVPPQAGAQAQG